MSGPNDLLPVKNCFDIFRLFRVEAPEGDQIDLVTDAHPDWGRSGLRDRRPKQAAFATPDGFGIRKPPQTAAEDLIEIAMHRYERASTILTSNRPVEDWGKLLGCAVSSTPDPAAPP